MERNDAGRPGDRAQAVAVSSGLARPTRSPLTVRRSPSGFVVDDPTLTRLAGFGALPLPFTPEADPTEVLAHLRRLNPHRPVRLDDTLPQDTPAADASTGHWPLPTGP